MIEPLHTVIFDLDGTLLDSAEGITASMAHAFAEMGIAFDRAQARRLIGPPLLPILIEACRGDETEARRMMGIYRAHHQETGIRLIRPFDGVSELLEALQARGKRLLVATARLQYVAEGLMERCGIRHYFGSVFGAQPDGEHSEKTALMRYIVERLALDVEGSVMVGDRYFDVDAANAVHMRSIVTKYGYGSPDEFESAAPTFFVESIRALRALLLSDDGVNA